MHVLRTVFRPGWIALAVVVIAFAVACFTLLAPWQLGKSSSTEQRNDLIRAAVATEPVPLDTLSPTGAFDPATEWREVSITGRYLPADEALVRLRNIDEQPAVEVLTPFAVSGTDRVIAVNRGFVRPEQGAAPSIAAAPEDEITIVGRIRAAEGTSPGRQAHREAGALAVYTIDPAELGAATGIDMDPFYLQLSPGQPGSLGEIALPQLDSGPYLSYGLQWLAFGIMAPLGAAYFLVSEIRQRRRRPSTQPTDGARRRVRHDLQAAGTVSAAPTAGQVGVGPAAHRDPEVNDDNETRDKLTRRYGG